MNEHNALQNKPESASFLKSALALRGSVTPKVMKKVGWIIVYTGLVSYLCYVVPQAVLPIGPFEYGGLIMGLILVFRVNAGYDRWWEARKLWGNVVNQSRNLTLILVNYTPQASAEWILKITQMIAAYPYLMKEQIRNQRKILPPLDRHTQSILQDVKHRPLILASLIEQELKIAREQHGLDSFAFLQAQEQIQHLVDAQGACERILNTPMPFVMAVKARRFILFFLLMLPFALANGSFLMSPLIAGIVSYALFSLDQIGIELQNPFSENNLSHLPLDHLCDTIADDVQAIRNCASLNRTT